jgi:hypothetical protein
LQGCGLLQVAKAALAAAAALSSLTGLPRKKASASTARQGAVANPPSATRAARTMPSR